MSKPPRFATHEEWARWKGCTSKRAYDTIVEANVDVLFLWKAGKDAKTYPCPWGCGKIHITTKGGDDNGQDTERRDGDGRTRDHAEQPRHRRAGR